MSRDVKKVLRWWVIAALMVAVCRILQGCAPPPKVEVVRYTSVLISPIGEYSGKTMCELGGEPLVLLSPNLDTSYVKYVLIHEGAHVRQARAYPGGCRAYVLRYMTDPDFRFNSEAEAYCAAYMAEVEDGVADHDDYMYVVTQLVQYATKKQTVPCKEAKDEPP